MSVGHEALPKLLPKFQVNRADCTGTDPHYPVFAPFVKLGDLGFAPRCWRHTEVQDGDVSEAVLKAAWQLRTTSSTAAEKNAVEDVDKRDSSERSKFINKQSIASFQKEIEDELKSEPSHVLCGRVSRDPKDELHVQALRDKFAVIPASVSWSGLKRLLKLY